MGINKDHYWQKSHKIMMGCTEAAGRGCPTAWAWGLQMRGWGVVLSPPTPGQRDKRTGTARLARLDSHSSSCQKTLKINLGKTSFEKWRSFEDDVNFGFLNF